MPRFPRSYDGVRSFQCFVAMYPLSISKTTEPDEDGFDYVVKVHGSRIENPLNRYPGEAAAQGGEGFGHAILPREPVGYH